MLAGGYFYFTGDKDDGGNGAEDVSGLELPAIASSDEIIRHDACVICYDGERRIPEWVAYELTAEETGVQNGLLVHPV